MALRYGGDVRTRSADPSAMGKDRASPDPTRALGAPGRSTKGSLATVALKRRSHAVNGNTTGLRSDLWGRDRARSSANEAPTDFAMIKLEKTTQARSFPGPAGSFATALARAKSCF